MSDFCFGIFFVIKVRCFVEKDGYIVDLFFLIKMFGYYLVVFIIGYGIDTDGTFYINICRFLNFIYGKLCFLGVSVC